MKDDNAIGVYYGGYYLTLMFMFKVMVWWSDGLAHCEAGAKVYSRRLEFVGSNAGLSFK
jgi:hypothetical protein